MKKTVALFLCLATLFSGHVAAFATEATKETYDGFQYVVGSTSVTITGYRGLSRGVITIPDGYSFASYIPIVLNGVPLYPTFSTTEMHNGKPFVPLRFVTEALKHTVNTQDGVLLLDGGAFYHTVGTTMVPLDFIQQAFGCGLQWNAGEGCVEITAQ